MIHHLLVGARDKCIRRLGLCADPRFSSKKNISKFQQTTNNLDLPQKPQILQLHNLCNVESLVTQDMLDTLGLGLGHVVTIK